jgi:hypothetical protein
LIRGAGANVVVLESPDGLIMVDGGAPELGDALLEIVRGRSANRRVDT